MKKGFLMTFIAVIAAAVGIVITIMTALRREKRDVETEVIIDDVDFLEEDFNEADQAAFAEDASDENQEKDVELVKEEAETENNKDDQDNNK